MLTSTLHCLVKRAVELKDWELQILESRPTKFSDLNCQKGGRQKQFVLYRLTRGLGSKISFSRLSLSFPKLTVANQICFDVKRIPRFEKLILITLIMYNKTIIIRMSIHYNKNYDNEKQKSL